MLRLLGAGVLALLGLLGTILVVSAISVVGFDEKVESRPMVFDGRTYAVALDQQLIPFANTSAEVTVTSPEHVFIGTANGVDTASFLAGVAHDEVTGMRLPGSIEHRFITGRTEPESPATSRDWWITRDAGNKRTVTLNLEDDPRVLVVAPTAGRTNIAGTTVTVTVAARGVLPVALMGLAVSIVLFLGAWWLYHLWRRDQPQVSRRTVERGGQA